LDATDALLALAQFSLALAGFTGVVISFGMRDGEWHAADAFRTRRALISSLGAAFLCLVPVAIQLFGIEGAALWRASSTLFSLYSVLWIAVDARRHWRGRREIAEVIPTWGPPMLYSGAAVIVTGQVLNSLGVWFAPQPGVYFLGLLAYLLLPAVLFARIPFVRPKR
jgi:O-antigen/teichoic acid export membrane protein